MADQITKTSSDGWKMVETMHALVPGATLTVKDVVAAINKSSILLDAFTKWVRDKGKVELGGENGQAAPTICSTAAPATTSSREAGAGTPSLRAKATTKST